MVAVLALAIVGLDAPEAATAAMARARREVGARRGTAMVQAVGVLGGGRGVAVQTAEPGQQKHNIETDFFQTI